MFTLQSNPMYEKFFLDADEVLWYNPEKAGFWLSSVSLPELEEILDREEIVLDEHFYDFAEDKDPKDLYISANFSQKSGRVIAFINRDEIGSKAVFVDDRESNLCEVYSRVRETGFEIEIILMDRYLKRPHLKLTILNLPSILIIAPHHKSLCPR